MAHYQLHLWLASAFEADLSALSKRAQLGADASPDTVFSLANNTATETVVISSEIAAPITLVEAIEIDGVEFGAGALIEPLTILKSTDRVETTLVVARLSLAEKSVAIVLSSANLAPKSRFEKTPDGDATLCGQPQNCFARGTLIDTPHGAIPVERLEDGDEVMTRDGATQLVSWSGSRRLTGLELVMNPDLQPIRIMAGALTGGRPGQDLSVSQEHRLLVDDWRAAYLFGEEEILVPAKSLLNNVNVVTDCPAIGVEYFHLLMAQHSMVCANGLWAETMLPGVENMQLLSPRQRVHVECAQQYSTDTAAKTGHSTLPALPHHSAAFLAA